MLSPATATTRTGLATAHQSPVLAAPRKRLHVTCFIGNKSQQQQASATPNKVIVGRKPSSPPELIKEEQQSLQAALKAAGLADNVKVTDLSPSALQDVLSTIKKGLDKGEEDLPKLEGAMLLVEQLFHAYGGRKLAVAGVADANPQSVDVWQVRAFILGLCIGQVAAVYASWQPQQRRLVGLFWGCNAAH